MNNLQLIIGNNFNDVNKAIIKKIDVKDFSRKNFVIVPDRYSLLAEKQIFKILNIKSFFNIEVIGISDLANKVFEEQNLQFEYVNKEESKILIRKVLKNLNGNLKYFTGKVSSGLVDMIYNSISMLKTNRISPQNLTELDGDLSASLADKMFDLSQILQNYNSALNGKLDSSEILEKLSLSLENYNAENINFYYVNFDSFTKQGFEILKNLAKTANDVFVGTILGNNQKNKFIYEKEIFEKISELAKLNNIKLNIENISNSLTENQNFINENLFALSPNKTQNNFVKILQTDTQEEEIEAVAKQIKMLIANKNVRYKNIAVACGNLENYAEQINKIFSKYNFAFFVDAETSLMELETTKFILEILKTLLVETDINNFKIIIYSSFSEIDENSQISIFDFVQKYDIKNNILLTEIKNENIENILKNIKNKINKLKINKNSQKNINFYLNLIKNIIFEFNLIEKNEKFIEEFKTNNYLKQEKLYSQIFNKLEKIYSSLEKVFGEEEMLPEDFYDIFHNYISSQNLSTIPLTTDSIFVGDASSSFYEEVDYLFVLGANENSLPYYINDTAIISDDAIEKLEKNLAFSPTVKMINRRNKFKVLSLLLNAKTQLILTLHAFDKDGKKLLPSVVVSDICKIFQTQIMSAKPSFDNLFYENDDNFINQFLFETAIKQNAEMELVKIQKFNKKILNNSIGVVNKFIALDFEKNKFLKDEKVENLKELFFKKDLTKISQIEKFYQCPFKHFLSYGLNLLEKEKAEIGANEIGQFLHKVAEEFLSPKNNYLVKINKNELKIEEIIKKIIKKCENNSIFSKLLLKINKCSFSLIKTESENLCKFLYNSSLKTNFKTRFVEVFFGNENFAPLEIKVYGNNFKLIGVVDRIDVYKNMFVIIDYKTGKVDKTDFSELYYGDKIQIFAYAKALQNILTETPAGIFYFPISNNFNNDNDEPYILNGMNLDDNNFLNNFDTSLNMENSKSTIFNCKLKVNAETRKTGEKLYWQTKNMTPKTLFNASLNYSIKMIESAISEILDGIITPSPRENSCKFCPYVSICGAGKNINERKNIYNTTKDYETFLLKEGEDD